MKNLYEKIKKEAEPYFASEAVDSFITLIQKFEDKITKHFFQITQKGDEIQLEFSAFLGSAFIDLTKDKSTTSQTFLLTSAINSVRFDENQTKSELHLRSTNFFLGYVAVNPKSRSDLLNYFNSIQSILFGETK